MSWADLFERAEAYETDVETIRATLAVRRDAATDAKTEAGTESEDA